MESKSVVSKILTAILLLLTFISCGPDVELGEYINPPTEKGQHNVNFYYWKNKFNIGIDVQDSARELGATTLYVHFFDIVCEDGKATPMSVLHKTNWYEDGLDESYLWEDSVKLVPVVSIDNNVFSIDRYKKNKLAEDIVDLVNRTTKREFTEVQLDCDWTETTKDKYFSLIYAVRKKLKGKRVSCTIGINHVRDSLSVGIPPVGRGYLKCYSLDSDSILSIQELKNNSSAIKGYPLQLDYAFPIYSWAVASNTSGEVRQFEGLSKEELKGPDFEFVTENKYKVVEGSFVDNVFLNKDFTIEFKEVEVSSLRTAKQILDETLDHGYNIVYFQLDEASVKKYSMEDLK